MSLYINNYVFLFALISCVQIIKTVVPDYCLQPLNSNDCGAKPTAVMTYWKPGSRCEIDVWRGCPTVNKFEDEYNCSSTCIFNIPSSKDECVMDMDESKCNEIEQVVYTYRNGLCEVTVWRGCPTANKFINRTACINTCAQGQFQDKLENMDVDKLKLVSNILQGLVNDNESISMENVEIVPDTNGNDETATEQDKGSEEVTLETTTEQPSGGDNSTEAGNDSTDPPATDAPTTTASDSSFEEIPVITA